MKKKLSIVLSFIMAFALVFSSSGIGMVDIFAAAIDGESVSENTATQSRPDEDVLETEDVSCTATITVDSGVNNLGNCNVEVSFYSDANGTSQVGGNVFAQVQNHVQGTEHSNTANQSISGTVQSFRVKVQNAGKTTACTVSGTNTAVNVSTVTSNTGQLFAYSSGNVNVNVTLTEGGGGGGGENVTFNIDNLSTGDSQPYAPAVYEDWYDWDQSRQNITWHYNRSRELVKVSIDDRRVNMNNYTGTTGHNFGNDTTLDITLLYNWSYKMVGVEINNVDYTSQCYDYTNANKMMVLDNFSFVYRDQDQRMKITVPKGDRTYNIKVKLQPITRNESFIGNFLWTSDPSRANEDCYVANSDLSLISVQYPDWITGEANAVFDEQVITRESEEQNRNNKRAKYVTYGVDRGRGEMVLPIGTKVKMRVAPHHGYQVRAFKINGTPIDDFVAEGDVAVFTFTIGPANYHLSADVVAVPDEVVANATAVDSGNISLSETDIGVGSARLDVVDANASAAEIADMQAAVDGYELGECMDLMLTNFVYKGNANDTWDTNITNLRSPATVSLRLKSAPAGNRLVVVHQKHDGTIETIPATYDASTMTATFQTSGFSKYAIASRQGVGEGPAVNEAAVNDTITNLYSTILGRTPDAEGLNNWKQAVTERKISGAQLIKGFLDSPEFVSKNLSNEEFVKILYRTFLGREADAEGLASWVKALKDGATRDQVMAGFANSDEFTGVCDNMKISRGTMDPNGNIKYNEGVYKFVQRCYSSILDRDGETRGVEDWTFVINAGAASPKVVAENFLKSAEFNAKNLTDEEYVTLLYRVFLGREPDAQGLADWVRALQSGSTRQSIVSGFSDSAEFSGILSSFNL